MLNSMRFKDFVWPHNPTVYSISFERPMALHKIPFGRYSLQSLGMSRRIMKGEGAFAGENAYQQFKALASTFYENSPGTLVHPLWDTTTAWFVALELEQEPRENFVKYRFEFWEDYSGYKTGTERCLPYHVLRPEYVDRRRDVRGRHQHLDRLEPPDQKSQLRQRGRENKGEINEMLGCRFRWDYFFFARCHFLGVPLRPRFPLRQL